MITDGNVHKTGAAGWGTQEVVPGVDLSCSGEQGINGYPKPRLVAEVDDIERRQNPA